MVCIIDAGRKRIIIGHVVWERLKADIRQRKMEAFLLLICSLLAFQQKKCDALKTLR